MNILLLFCELIPLLLAGYFLGRFKKDLSTKISKFLMDFGVPISLIGLLLNIGLDLDILRAGSIALAAIGLSFAIVRFIPGTGKFVSNRILLLGSVFGNTGYLGVPVALALLPSEAVRYSIGYDLGATLLIWSLGPMLLAKGQSQLDFTSAKQQFLKAITSSPAFKGLLGTLMLQVFPWRDQLGMLLWIPARVCIMLALIIVGMNLSLVELSSFASISKSFFLIHSTLIFKLIAFPLLLLGLSIVFGVNELMRNALVLQAATPTAISVFLLADAFEFDKQVVTSLLLWTTILSFLTIPIWFSLLS